MPRYPKPSLMSLTPLAPMPPTDETYSLSTYIHHTFTLTDAATYFTLTPATWLSTLARLCRTRPDRMDIKRWYALRIALLSSDWLDRLDDAHLDLIAQLGCFDELR